jgi:mannitol-specific phosphotransferase system IIBC component
MAFEWLRPNQIKIALFVVLFVVLFFLPVVPVLSSPVIAVPSYTWGMQSPYHIMSSMGLLGVSSFYFGVFMGAEGAVAGTVFALVVAYILACVLAPLVKKEPKAKAQVQEAQPKEKAQENQPEAVAHQTKQRKAGAKKPKARKKR